MDVLDIARAVARRWWVTLPVLLLTAGAALLVVARAEPQYEVSGSFLLADAALVPDSDQLAARDEGQRRLTASPTIIAEIARGDDVRLRVMELGGTGDYELQATEGDQGLVRVTAAGDSEEVAVTTVHLVIDEIHRVLAERQDAGGIPEGRRLITEVLSEPSRARQEVTELGEGEETVRYVANGSLRFVGPAEMGANPYAASFGGTIRVLEERMRSPVVREEVREAGGTGAYDIGQHDRETAPIILVVGRGTSAEQAMGTFATAVRRLEQELQQRQEAAGAAPSTWLAFEPLSVPTRPTLIGGELRRPLIVIVGLGIAAALSLAVLVEGLANRRRTGVWQVPGIARDTVGDNGEAIDEPATGEAVHWR